MKICSIMQPTFNPWLGYFDLLDQSDIFVFYDDVQLSKQSWQVRNRIKTSNGELLLTIPYVRTDKWSEINICNAITNETIPWRKKHLKSIENSYSRSAFFKEVFSFIETLYNENFKTISSFNTNMIRNIAHAIGIKTENINSSNLPAIEGVKDERLAKICTFLKADTYLSPMGSSAYIEESTPGGELAKINIEVLYHVYKHPVYTQLHGDFLPYMGIIDCLFNVGFTDTLGVIRSGRQDPVSYRQLSKSID